MTSGKLGRTPATCHPEEFQHAKGLCRKCYMNSDWHRAYDAAKKREWRKAHPEQFKEMIRKYREEGNGKLRASELHYRKTYGIEFSDFKQMVEDRESKCDICHTQTKLVLDHDHTTNKIRGLLCSKCNRALGALGDTPESIQLVLAYLEKST